MNKIVEELASLHKKRLKVDFETDEAQQERAIDEKTMEITEIFHHAENLLKKFARQSEDPKLTVSERTVRKNMQMSMAKKLQTLSMSFRSTQKVLLVYELMLTSLSNKIFSLYSNICHNYKIKRTEEVRRSWISYTKIKNLPHRLTLLSILDLMESK